jgi:hypothetical protein
MITYHAKNLEDVAQMFDEHSRLEDANASRAGTTRNASICRARASVWRSAAEYLRSTQITLTAGEDAP